ncbi:MAG: type II secretion system F family protein [Nitrososphaerota archaeon]
MRDEQLWLITCLLGFMISSLILMASPGSPQHAIQPSGILAGAALARVIRPSEGLVEALVPKASTLVSRGGLYVDPRKVAMKIAYNIQMMVIAAACFLAVWIPTGAWLGYKFEAALALAPLPLPLIKNVYVELLDKVRERREKMEKELPFFMSLVAILTRAGLTLYSCFLKVMHKKDLLPQSSKEGYRVWRDEFLGLGVVESIEKLSEEHPSEEFRRSILGITSVWRAGGDVAAVSESTAMEQLRRLEDRWVRYANSISTLGELISIIFLLLPLSIGVVCLVFPHLTYQLIMIVCAAVIPLLAIFAYAMIKTASPALPDRYELKVTALTPLAAIAAGSAAAAIIPSMLGFNIHVVAVACGAVAAGSLALYLSMRWQVKEVEDCEKSLVRFIKDVSEMRKFGYTIRDAVERCLQIPYAEGFRKILKKIVGRLRMGVGFEEASKDVRSTLTRIAFYLLSEVEESGGGSPQLLDRISDLLRTYLYARDKSKTSIRLYQIMSVALPFIVVATSTLIWCISGLLTPVSQFASGSMLTIATQKDVERALPYIMIMTLEGVAAMGFIANRAIYHHPFNVWNIAVLALITMASYFLIGPLASIFSKALGLQEVAIPGVVG